MLRLRHQAVKVQPDTCTTVTLQVDWYLCDRPVTAGRICAPLVAAPLSNSGLAVRGLGLRAVEAGWIPAAGSLRKKHGVTEIPSRISMNPVDGPGECQ